MDGRMLFFPFQMAERVLRDEQFSIDKYVQHLRGITARATVFRVLTVFLTQEQLELVNRYLMILTRHRFCLPQPFSV